ncbi:hypothetical protein GKQ38_04630 [Candidatus Nanohaloarchaea archaeon]|nr:hypothetical protein GKQ38_04630 [Candidatus Nanohaloarchaea archaeon]
MSYKEMLSEENIKEKASLETVKKYWGGIGITAIFSLALWLRYLPEQGMQYLQALDPYFIFRQSRHLALSGNIPLTDFMRYFPYNAPNYVLNQGDIVFPAIMYHLGPSAIFANFTEWAQFYPALMGAFSVVVMYFLGKELYGKVTGLSSAFFLATVAGIMHRTSAGFFEKEPIGTFLMMASLYFFTRSWKRNSHISGALAGLSLGAFTITWGGAKMLWMLYPMTVGIVMLLNEDIRRLVTVYTPTVVLGVGVASVFNYSRFWITGDLAVVNFGMLGFLWSRYLLGEFNWLSDRQLSYYVPTMSVFGLIALLLSPLYSQFLADKFFGLISKAAGAGGTSVILRTVAENQAASFSSLVSSLGASYAQPLLSNFGLGFLAALGNLTGALQLALIGTAILGTKVGLMLLKKYGYIEEEVSGKQYYAALAATYSAWSIFFISFFEGFVLPGIVLTLVILGSYWTLLLYTDEESLFSLEMMVLGFTAATQLMMVTGQLNSARAALPATLAVLGSIGIVYYTENLKKVAVNIEWYQLLPLLWMLTNFLSAISKSRLMTLAVFPVALVAGITVARAVTWLRDADLEMLLEGKAEAGRIAAITVVVLAVAIPNVATGLVASSQIGGSPNSLWDQNLEYMEDNTENGSVILSWWDYGYHFQTIGRRASVADGGNLAYYSDGGPVNYPLADYLATPPDENTDLLQKMSVDYIVLDHSMIGKYSAVSQIHNRNNSQFNSMLQLYTTSDIRQSTFTQGNQTLVRFSRGGLSVYVPTNLSSRTGIDITDTPTVRTSGGQRPIGCKLTEDQGIVNYNVSNPVQLQGMGEVCIAESPFFTMERGFLTAQRSNIRAQASRMVLVPRKISDTVLVRLYLMNGHGVEYAEPVPGGSNGYVRMWKVDRE